VTSARDRDGIDALVDTFEAHLAAVSGEAQLARRKHGRVAWAISLFTRRFGEHGVATLGGREALHEKAEGALAQGLTPVGAAESVGALYLAAIKAG
jgi:putative protein kinase ArgK-like GTPase of G3E family